MQKKTWIQLKNVSKNFRLDSGTELKVLEGVNFELEDDEIVALLGPSGSGKSTCLRIMVGFLPPSDGEVFSSGKKLESIDLNVAFVFQAFALFPWETVYQNIALALKPLNLPALELRARVKNAVDLVGLEGFEEAYPRELSGGMKQRVGLARALVMDRPVLFLDEPFSSLDVLTADTLRSEMVRILMDKKTGIRSAVIVTHNIQEAVFMAKRIMVMGTHPGHIKRQIINDLSYPRDESSPAFRRMVAQIHTLITETLMPDTPAQTSASMQGRNFQGTKIPPIETLPNVQITEVIGLIEIISDQGGSADIFELSQDVGKDFGKILYLAKAGEILGLLETPQQTVILTEDGKKFTLGDINLRKKMLHELFGSLRIVQMTHNLLQKEDFYRIPIETLTERVAEWLPNENPHQIVGLLVSWGRFAEYFGYNDDTKEIYLDLGQELL